MSRPANLSALLNQAAAFVLAGGSWENLTASGYFQIVTGVAVAGGLTVNTGGTSSAVALYDGTSSTVTISIATPAVISWPSHGLAAGTPVKFTTTGALPTGLVAGTTYYVSTAGMTADAFEIADTQAHALAGTNSINTSGSQSGVHTGWDVSTPMGSYSTTAQNSVPFSVNGRRVTKGLIAIASDGGGAANLTVDYF